MTDSEPDTFRITVYAHTFYGKQYASSPAKVAIGGTVIDGYAVSCDDQKWVSTREDCEEKLVSWGLNPVEANMIVEIGILMHALDIKPIECQEAAGLYDEECQKFRDGVLEDIRSGEVKTQARARYEAYVRASQSTYCQNPDFILVTLRHGKIDPLRLRDLAKITMMDDVRDRLEQEELYKKLPPGM